MNENLPSQNEHPPAAASPVFASPSVPAPASTTRWLWLVVILLGAVSAASAMFAWKVDQRGASLEQELVRRQQEISGKATEARVLAKQAQEGASDATAKLALLESRVAEVVVHRGQLEELIQSMSRSRDENLLVDMEAALRVALQQSAITGSTEPLVATLKQGDERLARYNQPRLEGVRRAIARDLDRVKAVSVTDIASLAIKLDEAIRTADELPLLADVQSTAGKQVGVKDVETKEPLVKKEPAVPPKPRPAGSAPAMNISNAATEWSGKISAAWDSVSERLWTEAKALVRVTRIEHPEAVLLSPEQSFFVRENLKLRLLNARLAVLSRQFDTAQADLQMIQVVLNRYFDRSSKRTMLASELIRQVLGQARQVTVPRPDDTLAAIAAASAGR
jgi:uroporphyrin-III C-methyltransferase